jgi:hypothetical protein
MRTTTLFPNPSAATRALERFHALVESVESDAIADAAMLSATELQLLGALAECDQPIDDLVLASRLRLGAYTTRRHLRMVERFGLAEASCGGFRWAITDAGRAALLAIATEVRS